MNPHSTHSQFNQRLPKAGPASQSTRFMDVPSSTKPGLPPKPQRSATPAPKGTTSPSLAYRRPIATNSRVKNDERMRTDMFLAYINNAFQQKGLGNPAPFIDLVNQFSPKKSSEEGMQQSQLRYWLAALTHVVSRLDRPHATLVEALVNMPWTTMDTATVKSYTVFIGVLLSARPEYLSLLLGKIAQGFTHQSGLQALNSSLPESSSSPLTRRDVYDRQHYLLQHLLSLIPTLPSTLMPLLMKNFPHKRQKQVTQTTFIRNILRVSAYCPELSDKILETIVDRAIQIDVEIQVELEELEESLPGALDEQDIFELDPFDSVVGQDESSDSDSDSDDDFEDGLSDLSSDAGDMDDDAEDDDVVTDMHQVQDTVKKLDAILSLLFEHFDQTHTAWSASASSSSSSLNQDLPLLPPLLSSPATSVISYFPSSRPSSPSDFPPSSQPRNPSQVADTLPRGMPASPLPSPLPFQTTSSASLPPVVHRSSLRNQFHALLAIFDRTILKTFKSRYTQFLLFWYSSLDPEYSDVFQGMLVDRALFQSSTPTVTRAAAASYIGSLVSRANFVDRDATRRVTSVLCEFIRSHLDFAEESELNSQRRSRRQTTAPRSSQNTVFYSVCQAFFLIFCFRWSDLMEDPDEEEDFFRQVHASSVPGERRKKWMKELAVIQRAVNSSLNPLRACSPAVAAQFARVALAADFVYCYNVLDSNKRSDARKDTSPSRPGNGTIYIPEDDIGYEMTTFFPFDPYKLPRSQSFIHSIYRSWESVAIDDEGDDGEEEDEIEDFDLDGGRLAVPRPQRQDDRVLNASLGAMSISPANPLSQAQPMSVS